MYLRYMRLQLYDKCGTRISVILEAPTVMADNLHVRRALGESSGAGFFGEGPRVSRP